MGHNLPNILKTIYNTDKIRMKDETEEEIALIKSKTDTETFLPWAKQDYACIVLNLRVEYSQLGLEKARSDFQLLIDVALNYGGSYFLTYHRWARKDQLLEAYPQFPVFLDLKLKYDPQEMFQSDWYRFYKEMFSNGGIAFR